MSLLLYFRSHKFRYFFCSVCFFKGTQAWEFLGLWFRNLYFFVVSYAWMLRFCIKKILVGPLLGEIRLFCVYWDYAEQRIFSKLGKKNFISQISKVPFIFANNSFSKIWSINSYMDGFILQNVKNLFSLYWV